LLILCSGVPVIVAGPGVLIPSPHAGTVARALSDGLRRVDVTSPELEILVSELGQLASEPLPLDGDGWLSVAQFAERARVSERTVRRRLECGQLAGKKDEGRWRVRTDG